MNKREKLEEILRVAIYDESIDDTIDAIESLYQSEIERLEQELKRVKRANKGGRVL